MPDVFGDNGKHGRIATAGCVRVARGAALLQPIAFRYRIPEERIVQRIFLRRILVCLVPVLQLPKTKRVLI
jgi:hypothetical protein